MTHTLTRKHLNRLSLPPGAADAILRLHEQEVAALRDECAAFRRAAAETDAITRERDALQAQLTGLQQAKTQAEAQAQQLATSQAKAASDAHHAAAARAAREALLAAGANARALPLLLQAVDLDTLTLDDSPQPALADAAALISPLRVQYADFFAEPKQLAVPQAAPPTGFPGALTAEALRGMDAAQINANWDTVKAALAHGVNASQA